MMSRPSLLRTHRNDAVDSGERIAVTGLAAGILSTVVLAWRGRAETGSAAAPINAVSHWLYPRRALWRDDVSWRHTANGAAVHIGSAMFWAVAFEGLRRWRERNGGRPRNPADTVVDAAAVTAVAAVTDLKLVPERFSPGFERRIEAPSVAGTYVTFAIGLAIADLWLNRRDD